MTRFDNIRKLLTQEKPISPLYLVGIDVETLGLNDWVTLEDGTRVKGEDHYGLIQIAVLLCRSDLSVIAELNVGIKPTELELAAASPFALEMHQKSGLLEAIQNHDKQFEVVADKYAAVEKTILEFLAVHNVPKFNAKEREGGIIFGNTVRFDVDYLNAKLPAVAKHFSHRTIDVSSIELLRQTLWGPTEAVKLRKEYKHTAIEDIHETRLELLQHTQFFSPRTLFGS